MSFLTNEGRHTTNQCCSLRYAHRDTSDKIQALTDNLIGIGVASREEDQEENINTRIFSRLTRLDLIVDLSQNILGRIVSSAVGNLELLFVLIVHHLVHLQDPLLADCLGDGSSDLQEDLRVSDIDVL